jgi:hypothetical protein
MRTFPLVLPVFAAAALLLAACAGAPAGKGDAAGAMKPAGKRGELPKEIGVTLRLEPGNAWKSRFVSTGEVKRSWLETGGKPKEKDRTVGVEIVALQKVVSVEGTKARIEVTESSTRILQEGKFVEAPFRKFSPPNPAYFTLDTATGSADFTELRKAWADWMSGLAGTPAGEIFGRTFRADSYAAQLEDLYTKPFNRLAGRRLSKEMKAGERKEMVLPYVGPSASLAPIGVDTFASWDGFERKDGLHLLRVSGRYEGKGQWSREDAASRLADFSVTLPAEYRSEVEATGKFKSSVDVLAGREIDSVSDLLYKGVLAFPAGTLTEEIRGRFTMEPAE